MRKDWPFGARREYPFFYRCDQDVARKIVLGEFDSDIPEEAPICGTSFEPGGVKCTYDASLVVAKLLNKAPPRIPPRREDEFPGLDRARYLKLGEKQWKHQKSGSIWAARLAYCVEGDDCRTGKCRSLIGASILVDSRKTFIITRAVARGGWAREIRACTDQDSLVLYGRATDRAKWFHSGKWVRRYRIKDNKCKVHGEMGSLWADDEWCPKCAEFFQATFDQAEWIIGNFDIMVAQSKKDGGGFKYKDPNLWGWAGFMSQQKQDYAIVDECQDVRGYDKKTTGHSRRERVSLAVSPAEKCDGASATPEYGYPRDLWGIWETISGGLYSAVKGKSVGKPWSFHRRYCGGGHHGFNESWVADGSTLKEELKLRRDFLVLQRTYEECNINMPAIRHELIEIEPDEKAEVDRVKSKSKVAAGKSHALRFKLPTLLEKVEEELVAGKKIIVYTKQVPSAKEVHKQFVKLANKKDISTALKARGYKTWLCTDGISADARDAMAQNFTEHQGAGVWVASMGCCEAGITLGGAITVYFIEFSPIPLQMYQAGMRPRIPGAPGVTWVYLVVKRTYDERALILLLPKIEALAALSNQKDVGAVGTELRKDTATTEEVTDSLTKEVEFLLEFGDSEWVDGPAETCQSELTSNDSEEEGE